MQGQSKAAVEKENSQTDRLRFDECCKSILAWKVILAWILKRCLPEVKKYSVKQIIGFIEGELEIDAVPLHETGPKIRGDQTEDLGQGEEPKVYFDIRFTIRIPDGGDIVTILVNVEPQTDADPGYPILHRGVYYAARMISAQYNRNVGKDNYKTLHKVYSIWIMLRPRKSYQNSIVVYGMEEKVLEGQVTHPKSEYDKIGIVLVYLGDRTGTKDSLLRLLDGLMGPDELPIEPVSWLKNEFDISLSQKEQEGVKEMRDFASVFIRDGEAVGEARGRAKGFADGEAVGKEKGRAEGFADGEAVGKEKGRAEGELNEAVRTVLAMWENHEPVERIVQYTRFTEQEVDEIVASKGA